MRSRHGGARPLLLVVLALSVAVAAASLWYLAVSGPATPSDDVEAPDGDDGEGAIGVPRAGQSRVRQGARGATAEEGDDEQEGDEWTDDPRLPEGPDFVVDDASLRKVFAERHWEEVRRQIDVLQDAKHPIPADVIEALAKMLAAEDTRVDAVLVLGMIKDDATGLLLARLATDSGTDTATRAAALDALAKSGQAAGLSLVRTIVESPGTAEGEDRVLRQALRALAAMGGDGIDVLLRALDGNRGGDLEDAIVTALARARGADAMLSMRVRAARDASDTDDVERILRVFAQSGAANGPEARAEVTRLIESPGTMTADAEALERVFQSALSVGASMGGEAYEAVVRVALDGSGTRRDIALYALRQGRGDGQAQILVGAITPARWAAADAATRWNMVNALGATESPRATELLLRALDDEDSNVRDAAAAALGQVRDPASVGPMLDKLEKSLTNFDLSRTLVDAIGRTLSRTAEKRLTALLEREFTHRENLTPYIRRALYRIEKGNPDATLLK